MEKLNNYLGVDMVQFTEYNNVSKKPETKSYQMNEKAKEHNLLFVRDNVGYSIFNENIQITVMNLHHAECFFNWLDGNPIKLKPTERRRNLLMESGLYDEDTGYRYELNDLPGHRG